MRDMSPNAPKTIRSHFDINTMSRTKGTLYDCYCFDNAVLGHHRWDFRVTLTPDTTIDSRRL